MRRLTVGCGGLLALLAIAVGVAVFVLYGSGEAPAPVTTPRHDPDLDDKTGWYRLATGDEFLLFPSARGGLYGVDFEKYNSAHFAKDGARAYTTEAGLFGPGTLRFAEGGGSLSAEVAAPPPVTAKRKENPPYAVEEVFFDNGGIRLAGVLFTPPGDGPHHGVVIIHGSGDSDRDNRWYLTIVDRLVRAGCAVLLPDKRGCGKSEGNWRVASFADFAQDTLAGHDCLQGRDKVDPARVGVLGISQGGWIAPLTASKSEEVAFVINLSGSAVPPNAQLRHESAQTLEQDGVPEPLSGLLAPVAALVPKLRRPTWWGANGPYDPIPHWRTLDVPAFVAYGTGDEDDNVPVQASVARLEAAATTAPGGITVHTYPESGHGLYDPETGRIREDFFDDLLDWLRAQAALPES